MACTRRTRRRVLVMVAVPLVPGDARRSADLNVATPLDLLV